jgi:hypothetical protein
MNRETEAEQKEKDGSFLSEGQRRKHRGGVAAAGFDSVLAQDRASSLGAGDAQDPFLAWQVMIALLLCSWLRT